MSQEDMDADDLLLNAARSGAPAAQFPSIGYVLDGTVTQRPRKAEQRDVDGKVKTFEDGTVRMQVLIEVQTSLRNPDVADDDGLRTIWCKWEIQKAVSQALIDAGVKRLEIGGRLQVGRTQDEPPAKKGYKPTQKFVAKYTPPASAADDVFTQSQAIDFNGPATAVQPKTFGQQAGTAVFENQHEPAPAQPRTTTLDQLKNTSFSAQGVPQHQEPPF